MNDRDDGGSIARRTVVLGVVFLLAGCGRKSTPKHPRDATYPGTTYPTRPSMGLPQEDPLAPPSPKLPDEDGIEAQETDEDRRPVGAYSAPPRGMR